MNGKMHGRGILTKGNESLEVEWEYGKLYKTSSR